MRWILLLIIGVSGLAVFGCGPNMTQTPSEIAHTERHIWDLEGRELQDDIQYLLLLDRPSRLTRWETE